MSVVQTPTNRNQRIWYVLRQNTSVTQTPINRNQRIWHFFEGNTSVPKKKSKNRARRAVSAVLYIFDLGLRKFPHGALFQAAELHFADGYSMELLHGVAYGFAHFTDLAVFAF